MEPTLILVTAVVLDLVLGEPPNKLHPVAWQGNLISLGLKLTPKRNRSAQLAFGIVIVIIFTVLFSGLIYLALNFLRDFNTVAFILCAGIIFKFTFSVRGLMQTAVAVKTSMAKQATETVRMRLQSLVSRDTSRLDDNKIISATVESVAENSCDSFIAPLFYFLILGVAGAVAYRIINTFDSMIGYHGEWEYTGKFAAILDDTINFIPARISALLIVIAAFICRQNGKRAWQSMWQEHGKTESPNAGWTMSAMAGALEVRLEKDGHYILGESNHILSTRTIDISIKIVAISFGFCTLLALLIQGVIYVTT